MNRKRLAALAIITLAILVSFTLIRAQQTVELTVFAAASLTDAYEAIAEAFEAENPEVEVLYNFGGSSTLATQLVQGAPADIFASANNAQMQVAIDGGRIAGEPLTFARNRLVLIVPVDNPANIQSLSDLANTGIHLILAAPDVPIRTYTDTMLERMATEYGEDFRSAVLANLVSEEPNVRQVSAKVALGEADAGIVYLSDVTPDIADDVIALPIPDAFNTIASYPIAITNDTDHPEIAQAFVDFVLSDTGQDILVEWNFVPVNTLSVDGLVQNPLSLSADILRTDYTPYTLATTSNDGTETVIITFTGALLWDVLNNAQPDVNPDLAGDGLSMYLIGTDLDGRQSVIAWGEIAPIYGNQPIILAYEVDGESNSTGNVFLIFPDDSGVRRSLFDVTKITLHGASSE